MDLAKVDWKSKGIDPSKTALFIDDHQSAYKRVFLEMRNQGFYKFLIEDNYPYRKGDNYSFKYVCEVERRSEWPPHIPDNFGKIHIPLTWEKHLEHANFLKTALVQYYEFPPVATSELSGQTRFDQRVTSTPIVTDAASFNMLLASIHKDELTGYTHFAYVEIDPDTTAVPPGF